MQAPAAGTDEDEFGGMALGGTAVQVFYLQFPQPVRRPFQLLHAVLVADVHAFILQMIQQHPRQGAEVDVRTRIDLRRRNRLVSLPILHHQRNPFSEFPRVLGELHPLEQRMGRHRFITSSQKFDVLLPAHIAHMRQRHDEILRISDQLALNQISPELSGYLELFIHLNCFANINGSVRPLGGIIQFAQSRMTGSRIIPLV